MKIAILGTRGIPNHYGGFERITEYLATGLANKGHEVTVYNSHNHPNQSKTWQGATIQHCFDPEYLIGTAGQFLYDLNCICHARKNAFDVWLFMGYTSSSIWFKLFPRNAVIISNMDGMEWKRVKYPKPVQCFLKRAEKWAVKYSQFHIADSLAVKELLDKAYSINCHFIPYGADIPDQYFEKEPGLPRQRRNKHYLLMARMEPENNVEMILDGFAKTRVEKSFLVIGRTDNRFGKYLVKKFGADNRIVFLGGVFDQTTVESLRTNAALYFHGHSVGGTNPSLLEAMASGVLIAAHDNAFNRSVLGSHAHYFANATDVTRLIESTIPAELEAQNIRQNLEKIKRLYNWETIVNSYEEFILHCYQTRKREKYFQPERYAYK